VAILVSGILARNLVASFAHSGQGNTEQIFLICRKKDKYITEGKLSGILFANVWNKDHTAGPQIVGGDIL
jgi:hypothetical protein